MTEIPAEIYKNIIEASGLRPQLGAIRTEEDSEVKRVEQVQGQILKKSALADSLETEIKQLRSALLEQEKELEKAEKKKSNAVEQLSLASTQASASSLETLIAELTSLISGQEDEGLELLENLETKESELESARVFIQGANNTKKEIENEVQGKVKLLQEKYMLLETRHDQLLEAAPEQMKQAYKQALKKGEFKRPCSFISSEGTCLNCRFHLDRSICHQVDRRLGVETCPGCLKLLCATL